MPSTSLRTSLPTMDGISAFWRKHERRIQLVVLVATVALVLATSAILIIEGDLADADYWRRLGYVGIFLMSFLGSVSLVLPVPGIIAVCGAGGLEYSLVGVALLSGTGETLGEISGYAIGYGGRGVVERRRFFARVRSWMEKRGTWIIFLVSVVPNPVVDLIGIAAGSVRFPFAKFLAIVWVGKTIKGFIVVHSCFWLAQVIPWLG